MRTFRVPFQLLFLLSLVAGIASASNLTLSGSQHFPALDGSAQDADGLANGVFSVDGDLVLDGTIHCNDDAPLSPGASACPIRVAVAGNMTLEAGSGIFAENRRSGGNGGNIHLEVDGDLTLHGPDGSLPGAVVSTSRSTLVPGNAGSLTAVVGGAVELQAGSILAANSQTGSAGTVSVTGETVRVAGLVASGPSRTVLSTRFSGEALAGGILGQIGGAIHLKALGSSTPGLQIETDGIVVSQGAGGGRLVLLEACGIEVRGLIASISRNNGPSQVALRSGRGILIDGRDLGSEQPAEGRFGRVRADGIQLGAAGYLVDLFAEADIQVLGPAPATTGLFTVTSNPGELPLRHAGGTITAISLAGGLTATGNAFAAGRDVLGNRGGTVDLQARNDVTLDDAVVRAVGGYSVLSVAGVGGHIDVRSFQGAVSWTFGRGDVRPTGSFVFPARRGTIEITACSTIDTTGSQFPVNGGSVPPLPVEAEGICSPAAPSLPDGEPALPTCVDANQPPAPAGGPFSIAESSANGTVVGTVAANDPNPGQSHTFSILSGNTSGAFAIDGAGVITVANSAALDFSTNPVFNLTVEVTDDGTPPLSGTTTVTIHVINNPEAPVATDEGTPASPYVETVGNTILEVTASPVLGGAKVTFDGNILANDTDPDGPTVFTVTLESATPGAVVSLHPDGTFTYLPPPGFTGVDSFTYRITDPDGLSDTASVYINVEHRVWYVKNDAPADGLGRSTEPFDTLAEAESASSPGDTIYLFEGSGTTTGQSDGITLKSGQRLIGEAVQLTIPETVNINGVDGPTLRSETGNKPKIENDDTPDAPGEDNGVSVLATAGNATGIEIRGLDISGFDNAIDVTATGAHNADVTIRATVVSSAASEGIDVNAGSTGAVTLVVRGNTLTALGAAIDVQRTAGTAYITDFSDNVVTGNTAGTGINIFGAIFDAVPGGSFDPVSGGVTVVGSPGNGVGQSGLVLTSVQGSLSFSDLDVFADGGTALGVAGGVGGFRLDVTPNVGVLFANAGPAAAISAADVDLQLNSLTSSNSAASGVSLTNVTGTFSAAAGSAITNAGTTDFVIDGTSAAVTYDGTITDDVGQLVSVTNSGGSNKLFRGAITDGDDGDGGGISLTGNSSLIRFSGGMVLSTGSNAALTATGGGTVEVCDEEPCNPGATGGNLNKITTTTATALNVANTTIGANNLEFRSISAGTGASGPTSGIVLNTTGSSGGLKVKGAGSAGSGGTIQRSTGAGISLASTANVDLASMNVQNGADDGIRGNTVDNLVLTSVNVTANGDAATERGIELTELTGAGGMANCTVTGNAEDNVYILNDGAGNLTSFNVIESTFATTAQAVLGNDGFVIQNTGSGDMTVSITGSTFTDNRGDHFQASFDDTATSTASMDVTFSNNTLNTTAANDPNVLGGGITLNPNGSGDMSFMVSGNDIQQAFAAAINLNLGAGSTVSASMNGTVTNNVIGTAGSVDSGSESSDGIDVIGNGAGSITVTLTNNQVHQFASDSGIKFLLRDGAGSMSATVTGNTVKNPGTFAVNGIHASAGAAAGDTGAMCLHLSGNDVSGSSANGGTEIRVRQRFGTTVRLPGYGGANNDTTAVNTFISGQNSGATTSSAVNVPVGGGFIGGAACPTP